jgi:hypothetical protein
MKYKVTITKEVEYNFKAWTNKKDIEVTIYEDLQEEIEQGANLLIEVTPCKG